MDILSDLIEFLELHEVKGEKLRISRVSIKIILY